MRLVSEELVNYLLLWHSLKDVSRDPDNHIKRFVEEVAFDSQLQLGNVLSCNAFIVQLEQLLSDEQRVDLVELDREDELAVP